MSSDPDTRADLGRGKKCLLFLFLSVCTLLALDTLFRGYLALIGAEWTPTAQLEAMAEIESGMGQLIPKPGDEEEDGTVEDGTLLHPFTGYGTRGSLSQTGTLIREYRQHGPEKGNPESFDILLVGGSVAGLFSSLRGERFLEQVRADPRFAGRKVRLLNFAHGGFKQPQQTTYVAFLLSAGLLPDAILNIDGFNEAALSWDNASGGVFPLYPSRSHWAFVARAGNPSPTQLKQLFYVLRARDQAEQTLKVVRGYGLHWSAALGSLALGRMRQIQRYHGHSYARFLELLSGEGDESGAGDMRGPDFGVGDDKELLGRGITESWVQASISLDALCRARDIHYLHVLQPTLHDVGAKKVSAEEETYGAGLDSWIEGARHCYPLFRQAAGRLREAGVRFHDSSMLFADVTESIYYDVCHFEGIGLDRFADDVAGAFLESMGE